MRAEKMLLKWAFPPLVSTLVFFGIPMLLSKRDMWDSTVAQSGLLLNNLTGWQIIAFQSGWEMGLWLVQGLHLISGSLSIPFHSVNALFMTLCLMIISTSTYLFSKKYLNFSIIPASLAGVLVPIIPVWNVALSAAMESQIFYISIGILGILLFRSTRLSFILFGYFLCVVSFEMPTLVLTLTALSWASDCIYSNNRFLPAKRTIILGFSGISYFLVQRLLNPPTGEYKTYNSFEISNIPLGIAGFGTYAIIPLMVLTFSVGLFGLQLISNKESFSSTAGKITSKWLRPYVLLGIVIVSTFVPHLAVGKTTALWDVWDWNSRFTLILSIPLAMLTGLLCADVYKWFLSDFAKIWITLTSIVLALVGVFTLFTFAYKINQQVFSDDLVNSLQRSQMNIEPGEVEITGTGIPSPRYRSYESNYIFQEAFGKPIWWVGINQKYVLPRWKIGSPFNYYEVYFPGLSSCISRIDLNARGYSSADDIILNFLNIEHGQQIFLSQPRTTCLN